MFIEGKGEKCTPPKQVPKYIRSEQKHVQIYPLILLAEHMAGLNNKHAKQQVNTIQNHITEKVKSQTNGRLLADCYWHTTGTGSSSIHSIEHESEGRESTRNRTICQKFEISKPSTLYNQNIVLALARNTHTVYCQTF